MAPFILRVFVGSYFVKRAWIEIIKYKKKEIKSITSFGILSFIGGILLILGFLTQITSLFLILVIIFNIIFKIKNKNLQKGKLDFYLLLLAILLSLTLSGAGFLAIDLPL